jgi:hypothetical protein
MHKLRNHKINGTHFDSLAKGHLNSFQQIWEHISEEFFTMLVNADGYEAGPW